MNGERTKVLLIEDNPADARLVREMLVKPGAGPFDVTVADRLSRAIEMLSAGTFDVALVDLGLPDSAGTSTVEKVRAAAPGLALVVSTGLDDEEVALMVLRGGAQDYVVKGRVESEGLVHAIRYAMERTRAEQERRRLQNEMQAILDNLPGIAFFKDRQSRYVLANRLFTAYKNCLPADVVGKTDFDIYAADQARKIVDEDQRIFETGEPLTIEHRSAFSGRVFQITKVPLKDPNGAINGIVGMSFELTERVRAEEALRESEGFNRNLIESSLDCIKTLDAEGRLLSMSAGGQRLLEIENIQPYIGQSWSSFWKEEDKWRVRQAVSEAARGGTDRFQAIAPTVTGKTKWWDVIVSPIFSSDGRIDRLLATSRDVTELKKAEQELLREKAFSDTLFDPTSGRPIRWNRRFTEVSGYSDEEISNMKAPAAFYGEGDIAETKKAMASILARGHGSVELSLITKSGEAIPYEYAATVIGRTGEPLLLLSVGRDITERKRAGEERAKLEEQLAQAQKLEAVGQLAGGVAHDFNNILSVITATAEFLISDLPKGSQQRADAEEILKTAHRAAALTKQLLAFSRKQIVEPREVAVNDVLENSAKMLGRLIGEHVSLEMKLAPDAGLIFADPGQIDQVIMNLAVNARDAMPKGGKLVVETKDMALDEDAARVRPGLKPGGHVQIIVSDSGTGMPLEIRDRVFEPFFTTKEKGKGTGLGLAVVYGAVKQNHGHIEVQSEVGLGTTFKLYFPHAASGAQAGAAHDAVEAPRGRGETVLVVEDEEVVRRAAVRALTSGGYRVVEAKNGAEALEVLAGAREKVDLVLTDVIMPVMGGVDLCRRLEKEFPAVKTVLVSGYTDDTVGSQGEICAAHALINKPVDTADLLKKVREVLDGK